MRLSTELGHDEDSALATLAAALDAGITVFDTARAYSSSEIDLGHNERLIARAWRARATMPSARVVTKCGMRRDGGAWIPDGRAKCIAEDIAASVEALAGVPIDVLLLHAPDRRVSLSTTSRALARARDEGLARSVGVSNVSRKQLEEIAGHAPIAAVEIALGAYDDLAIRSGVVAYCIERGIQVFAYAPLGGPERALRLARDRTLALVAARHRGARAPDVFLAYLLAVRPEIVPIVGARRPETVLRFGAAAELALDDEDLLSLDVRFPTLASLRHPSVRGLSAGTFGDDAGHPRLGVAARDGEVVMLMGVAGAGKSRAAEAFVARGYERLNRDAAGGTLRGIAQKLDERLGAGVERLVLDNTYVTRAARHDVVRIATSHGARVRCIFFETPLADAQVNVVLRMIERFGRVLDPDEIRKLARTEPAALAPHALSRMTRDLERPAPDEGFEEIEVVPFVRHRTTTSGNPRREREADRAAVFVALDALEDSSAPATESRLATNLASILANAPAGAPCLIHAWRPGADEVSTAPTRAMIQAVASAASRSIELAYCPHPAGPPICWCRPPLPALFLAFARRHAIDFRASSFVGASVTDRAIALVLEISFAEHRTIHST
jgi:aryl-alcohol dehydrogenase-like predicted oxidoreductase